MICFCEAGNGGKLSFFSWFLILGKRPVKTGRFLFGSIKVV